MTDKIVDAADNPPEASVQQADPAPADSWPGAEDQVDRGVVAATSIKATAWWALRLFVIAAAGYVLWIVVQNLWVGILPVILALIICTVLAPLTSFLRTRLHFPDAAAAVLSVLAFFGVVGAIIAFVAPDLINQSRILYIQAYEGIQFLQVWAQGPPLNLHSETVSNTLNDAIAWLQGQAGSIAGGVISGISTATSLVIQMFMILVLVVFFLKDGHRFLPWLRHLTGRRVGWHLTELLTRAWVTLGGYIRAQAVVSAVDALFIGVGLWLIGVPMAFSLMIITFLAGFIPYIGAISAGALSVLVALVSLGFQEALLVLLLVIAVQQLEGNILSPLLQSRAMDLHPVIVLISVVVGGGLMGILGAFLSVPIVAVIAVVLRYLIDIMTLHAGEKTAEELEHITPEGAEIARLAEIKGRALRRHWRESAVVNDDADAALLDAARRLGSDGKAPTTQD
ncbi:AI-2E family transporter [Corynebacterium uterequi]|uniref:AI-2E family transporter n=1 Tax=Corynebacterium uterequi TaxID=1072256 RepID=UPI001F1694BD|nr:AI-2E family transporter [Corynebacterium uterequi]